MFDIDKIDDHFPMAEYREGQREAIVFAADAFNSGKRIVILECPTGGGKSPIGLTLMDMVPTAYYLTVTKVLQDQLVHDFSEVVDLKGRNAYPCTYYKRYGQDLVNKKLWTPAMLKEYLDAEPNCANGFCRTKWNRDPSKSTKKVYSCSRCFLTEHPDMSISGDLTHLPLGAQYSSCPYYEQVYKAVNSRKVVMNFSSFLYQTTLTRRFDNPRDLLITDESHNVEPELLDFVSLSMNDLHLQRHGIFIPELANPLAYAVFFEEMKIGKVLLQIVCEARAEENNKLEDEIIRVIQKYELFMSSVSVSNAEWVSEYEEKKTKSGHVLYRTITLRPVFAMWFPEKLLFSKAKKVLLMSATILNVAVMCRSLGINRDEVAAYRMKNRFPVSNRPIYYRPVAKCTGGKDRMGQWLPKLVNGVDALMDKYPNDRGIIHTHNFAIMDGLFSQCKPTSKERFLDQRNFRDKAEMLRHHAECQNTVVVAPAMHEGIDLVGDLSRFQIICKIPYANCFDNEQLARRVAIDRPYYNWLTALKLIQSCGRSVRSNDDFADTYILDEAFTRFAKEARSMLPDWFLEAVIRD